MEILIFSAEEGFNKLGFLEKKYKCENISELTNKS
jgi:hypothetical protein